MALPWEKAGLTKTKVADNGVDALKLISDYHPDIIITDIRMPGLDGLQLAREIASGNAAVS